MPEHKVGTREEYDAAREELLAGEKELTHRRDELTRQRQELPWVEIDKEYAFETDDGTRSLAELFDGRSQLQMYHFMYGPSFTKGGCPVCSSVATGFDGARHHLNARDVTFTCVSRAPLADLQAYKERMEWSFPWATASTEFNTDFGAFNTEEQLKPFLDGPMPPSVVEFAEMCGTDPAGFVAENPVLSTFALEGDNVYQTYSTSSRGLEFMMTYYLFLDRTPIGRNEPPDEPLWLRRWNEY